MRFATVTALGAVLVLATTTAFAQPAGQATAELRDPQGQVVGSATMTQESGGVRVNAQVRNLPPGPHGIHIHAVGRCDPPDFMTAAGHLNPENRQHGLRNPQGPHAGDLPNIEIAADGTAQYNALASMVTLGAGANSLFDADGSALVIHANPDDDVTDPTGNSGGRIACGVIARTGAPAAAAQPSPAPKPGAAPAAKPGAAPAAQPSPAPKPGGAPAQMPGGLPRTGDALGVVDAVAPWGVAGATMLLAGWALRRRRR